ncbi:PQQ-binding-like beta-propeller repeat protein [Micromonospora sp. U21]|uniref:outer membrane protein assembly factor BamB family protein n=1 Tax=Micromonospora sp. U21 TaxID=2824899 RepID=UPI001B365CB3|nr:PQQ-binding-like beta-propeller repeat protein [Micromonospora sp. U21]MBQ0905451.1 PQQ-binding-like beta-propeller repeat protein [Micromonospora sp. U21]
MAGEVRRGRAVRWRVWAAPAMVLVLVAWCGVGTYFMVKPGEWHTAATARYPDAVASPRSGVVAALGAAPLIVERRLRVFATEHDVWAEPLTAADGHPPFWSYHRFPADVTGVVAIPAHGANAPMVVVKWSDGALAGVDGRTGTIAWRATVERDIGGDSYSGGPTGVATVYGDSLIELFATETRQHAPVLVSSGEHSLDAFEPATGRRLWQVDLPECSGVKWTGPTVVAVVLACDRPKQVQLYDAESGRELTTWQPAAGSPAANRSWIVEPSGCVVAQSMCDGFHVSNDGGSWRIHQDGSITGVWHHDWIAVDVGDLTLEYLSVRDTVRAVSRLDGSPVWQRSFAGTVSDVTADRTSVYVVTDRDELSRLDQRTGQAQSHVQLPAGAHRSFHVYATDGYVVIDRSNFDFTDRNAKWRLPRDARPALLVAT